MSKNSKRFLHAAKHGKLNELRKLIQESDVDVNCINNYGESPLATAAFFGNVEVLSSLYYKTRSYNL